MFSQHKDLIYWLEESEAPEGLQAPDSATFIRGIRFPILKGIPKNLGELLYNDLWSRKIPFILTSGTMSAVWSDASHPARSSVPADGFERIKRKLGLDLLPDGWLSETTKPSPFSHKENALLYISESVPFPDNKDPSYISAVVKETELLINASHGHAAVLFTSYKAMDMVFERIKTHNPVFPLFRLDRGGASAIEQFKDSGNGVLFASGALWEGIDIPGDILSMLIIVRLPFAVPDPVSEWERTLYDSLKDFIKNVVVPEMLIKLKQGFGRLLRIESDTGVVAILDCRAGLCGTYRRRILNALPPCEVTADVNDVRQFFHAKKALKYFDLMNRG